MSQDAELISAYLQLGFQALFPLVVGSFKSLKTPASTKAKRKALAKSSGADLGEDDEEDEDEFDETLGWSDSLVFPILGSAALLGLWALLKYVGQEWINLFLGVYFSLAGVFAVQTTLGTLVNFVLRQISYTAPLYHIRITSNLKQIFHSSISLSSLFVLPISVALPALYLPLGRPFWISNILALSLATTTLSLLRLDSFLTAFLLLGLLLVYDVFWVFATPVMVTVAKGIDAPIKILAPKSPLTNSSVDFAMLGLGDIVVPGLVIALCLRFDMYRYILANPSHQIDRHGSFGRGYWVVSMISYILGLAGTMGVMHWSQKAQPALLYLSPACTLGPLLFALARGELKLLLSFSDAPVDEPKVDESIEAPSEAAMKAKAAVAEDKADEVAETIVPHVEEEDDSWMDGSGVATGQDSSKKKKRGGRKQ